MGSGQGTVRRWEGRRGGGLETGEVGQKSRGWEAALQKGFMVFKIGFIWVHDDDRALFFLKALKEKSSEPMKKGFIGVQKGSARRGGCSGK